MTSIVVIISKQTIATTVFFLLSYKCEVFTIWIIYSADIAELVATSARHVIAAIILLDPELAS